MKTENSTPSVQDKLDILHRTIETLRSLIFEAEAVLGVKAAYPIAISATKALMAAQRAEREVQQ